MDIEITKLNIIQKILLLQDENTMERLKNILNRDEIDWWQELSESEQQEIEQGINEADMGKGISHEQVMKLFDKWK